MICESLDRIKGNGIVVVMVLTPKAVYIALLNF